MVTQRLKISLMVTWGKVLEEENAVADVAIQVLGNSGENSILKDSRVG